MTGPGSGFKITPTDLDSSGSKLASFGDKMDATSSKLTSTHSKLTSSAGKDKSGVGSVISKFASKSEEVMGKLGKEASRVIKGASKRLKSNGAAHAENEATQTKAFKGVHSESSTTKAHTGENTAPQSTKTSAGADFKDPKTPQDHSDGGEQSTSASSAPPGGGKNEGGGGGATPPKGGSGGDSTEPSSSGSGSGEGSGDGSGGKGGPGKGGDDPGGDDPGGSHGGGDEIKSDPPVTHKPMSATDHSDQFKEKPSLPPGKDTYKDKDKLPDSNQYGVPPKPARGAKVEQLPEDRLTRNPPVTGPITHVDGKPVKEYVGDLSKQKANDAATVADKWKEANPKKKNVPAEFNNEKVCSAVAIDLKTGLVTQGRNGGKNDVVAPENLHPLLRNNYQNLRAYNHEADQSAKPLPGGRAHVSTPNSHAEVKATNELLWQREAARKEGDPPLDQNTLNEMRFDPRWTGVTHGTTEGDPAPACANCNTILGGVPSYTGRYNYDPQDSRYDSTMIPPHDD
jgi:hypothetical protein